MSGAVRSYTLPDLEAICKWKAAFNPHHAEAAAASSKWVLGFGLMGEAVGDRWDEWQKNLHYADYAILAAIAGGIVYLLWRRRRGPSKPEADSAPTPVTDTTP